MRVALGKPCVFGRIKPCVHAGEDGELPRWRHGELALLAKVAGVSLIGGDHLGDDFRHNTPPL
jgi:hypothetical protein